jgi:hypothetical protein
MKRPTFAQAAGVAGTGARQGELFAAEPWPEGFAYREEVISPDEERALAERFALLPLTPFASDGSSRSDGATITPDGPCAKATRSLAC